VALAKAGANPRIEVAILQRHAEFREHSTVVDAARLGEG
jgi:hypothetical protein